MNKLLIIIPCFNEEKSISPLLREISDQGANWETLVVDDGSVDRTFFEANKLSPTVRLVSNSGIGCAVQTGIKYAFKNDFDFAVQLDGDGQHPPCEIFKLLDGFHQSGANLIIGSRFMEKGGFRSTASRRAGISILKTIINHLTARPITDPTSGFRLLDKKAIQLFCRDYPLDYPEPVSIVTAHEAGLSVSEVSVTMRERSHGISSINGFKSFLYMFRVTCYLFLTKLRRYA